MLETTVISRWEDLRAISCEWNNLLADSSEDTVFLTWEWVSAWWHNYGDGRKLFTLLAREQGKLVGVAPFYIDEVTRFGRRWKVLKIMGDGSGDSDYQDCIAAAGLEREVAQTIVDTLVSRSGIWDVLEFESVPESSPFMKAFLEAAKGKLAGLMQEVVPCTRIALPSRWEEYLDSLKPRVRSKIRSSMAFLEKELRVVPVACRDPKELNDWLPILFDLHTR